MKRRTFLVDALVIVVCSAGFSLCLLLCWRDINATISRLDEKPIGAITFRHNTTQRRFANRVIWDRLSKESPVYNGDIVRTANLSEATITFTDGGIVDLYSNTLIQVFDYMIEFTKGGITANAADSGLVIASGDKRLSIDSGSVVRTDALQDGAMDIAVSAGAAVLESSGATSKAIGAGEALLVNVKGVALDIPRAAAIFPPPNAQFLTQSASVPLEFSWNKFNYPSDGFTRLEIASDRGFARIYFAEVTGGSRLSVNLPEGTWFWRLYHYGDIVQEEISYSRITITRGAAPVLLSPAFGQTFHYLDSAPSTRFQWTSSPEASSYLLEAADNSSLRNPALSIKVDAGGGEELSVLSSALSEGGWYWRVTPVYGRGFVANPSFSEEQQASAIGYFVIESGAELAAPVLMAPADAVVFNIEEGRRDFIFSWRKENEAKSYTLRVSANSDMSHPVLEKTLTDTFYRYSPNETAITEGKWYWTVQQASSGRNLSPASAPRTFTAMLGEVVQLPVPPPVVVRRSVPQPVVVENVIVEAPLRVQSSVLLPAPRNRAPIDGYTINAAGYSANSIRARAAHAVDFSWDRVDGANSYVLSIFKGSGAERETVARTPVLTENRYKLEDTKILEESLTILEMGNFFWQVEAMNIWEDGFIEQRGRLEENRLIFDVPGHMRTKARNFNIIN